MPIFLSALFLSSGFLWAGCDFKTDVKKVFSFSGPITVLLQELNLLKSPKLKGISVFHPVNEKDFSGKFYPGGIFLSHNSLQELSSGVVFFDESQDLRKLFNSQKKISGVEVKTRNMIPLNAFEEGIRLLSPYLSHCESALEKMRKEVTLLQEELLRKVPENLTAVFYMGEIRGGRRPELLMVNDGVVKWLLENKKITSYPSTLRNVNWSSKIMRSLPEKSFHVGVVDSGKDKIVKMKRSSREMTFYYPGALIPGISQLRAFTYFFNEL